MKRLSELNLFLAIVLLLFVLVAGPTQYLLGALSENIGNYVSSLSQLTFRTFTYSETRQAGWFGNWTLLYWAWWISGPPSSVSSSPASPADAPCANSSSASCSCPPPSTCSG